MQHFKALRIISLILGFTLVTFGCATSKSNQSVNIDLKAETVPEGICITFDNIPKETNRLFIMLNNYGGKEQPESTYDIIGSYSDIKGDILEQVKQTRKIVFPFVQAGQKYGILVSFENEKGQKIVGVPEWINTECIANAGIYFNDGLKLELNKNNTSVILSSEPEFSKEVQYAPEKYWYRVSIDSSENGSLSYSDKSTNGLYWDFEPQMTYDFKKGEYLQSGNYSAYVTAYRNVIYDNVTWAVEIAKTPEFIYSLKWGILTKNK